MSRCPNFRHIVFLCAAAVSAGCASEAVNDQAAADDQAPSYDRPYALIEPGTASSVRRESPVLVHQVDGQIPVQRRYGVPVDPGKHTVVVHFASGTSEGNAEKYQRTLDIEAAPCTRYRIVAHHTGAAHMQWEPVVYSEPIGECAKRFGKDAGAAS
jgi:hypothetical protein